MYLGQTLSWCYNTVLDGSRCWWGVLPRVPYSALPSPGAHRQVCPSEHQTCLEPTTDILPCSLLALWSVCTPAEWMQGHILATSWIFPFSKGSFASLFQAWGGIITVHSQHRLSWSIHAGPPFLGTPMKCSFGPKAKLYQHSRSSLPKVKVFCGVTSSLLSATQS